MDEANRRCQETIKHEKTLIIPICPINPINPIGSPNGTDGLLVLWLSSVRIAHSIGKGRRVRGSGSWRQCTADTTGH